MRPSGMPLLVQIGIAMLKMSPLLQPTIIITIIGSISLAIAILGVGKRAQSPPPKICLATDIPPDRQPSGKNPLPVFVH